MKILKKSFILIIFTFIHGNCIYKTEPQEGNILLNLLILSPKNYSSLYTTCNSSGSLSGTTVAFTTAPSNWCGNWAINSTTTTCPTGGAGSCYKSATTSNSGYSAASVSGTTGSGSLTFRILVSSQLNSDFCTFYINGVVQDRLSGTVNELKTYTLSSGTNSLAWVYSKDDSSTSGSDLCSIDTLTIP